MIWGKIHTCCFFKSFLSLFASRRVSIPRRFSTLAKISLSKFVLDYKNYNTFYQVLDGWNMIELPNPSASKQIMKSLFIISTLIIAFLKKIDQVRDLILCQIISQPSDILQFWKDLSSKFLKLLNDLKSNKLISSNDKKELYIK